MKRHSIFPTFGLLALIAVASGGIVFGQIDQQSAAAKTLPAVLPLNLKPLEISSWKEILRDPGLDVDTLDSVAAFEKTKATIQAYKEALKKDKGPQQKALLKNLYQQHIAVIDYLEEQKNSQMIGQYRQSFAVIAGQYAQLEADQDPKMLIIYTGLVSQYLAGDAEALASLSKLKGKVPATLKSRILLLEAAHKPSLTGEESKALEKNLPQLSRSGIIATRIRLAQHFAQKNALKLYRQHLKSALEAAENAADARRLELFSGAIDLWRQTEPDSRWTKAPIALSDFEGSSLVDAIRERIALEELERGNVKGALKTYRSLTEKYQGQAPMVNLDQRIASLEKRLAVTGKNTDTYENTLLALKQKYRSQKVIGQVSDQQVTAAFSEFDRQHRELTLHLLNVAERPSFKNYENAVASGLRFVDSTPNVQDQIFVKEKIAAIYVIHGDHASAVKMYDHLIAKGEAKKKPVYIRQALDSQRLLAKWPVEPPFQGIGEGDPAARRKLLSYYIMLEQLAPGDWTLIAHIGLIHMDLGERDQAFALWTKTLKANSSGAYPAIIAGLILEAYERGQEWDALESFAELVMEKNLVPTGKGVRAARYYLGEALYHGGKEYFAKKEYRKSWQKLAKFAKIFLEDPRRDEGLYLLAFAYHNDSKHVESIGAFVTHTLDYKQSPYRQSVLLTGGKWSTAMALEEHVMYFYQIFVNENRQDSRALPIRKALVHLYLGRELYGDATRIYKDVVSLKNVSDKAKARSALAVMRIEETYGDAKDASWGARKSLEFARDPLTMSEIMAFEARQVAKGKDANQGLERLVQAANHIDRTDPRVSENVAEIRFYLAETKAIIKKEEIFNIGIRDYDQVLNQHYALFMGAKKYYDEVCLAGPSSFCAPALSRIAKMTAFSILTIQEIKIPSTLDAPTVDGFNRRKNAVIAGLTQIALKANRTALGYANRGLTTPQYANDIIWDNSHDWNFDDENVPTGNVFTQWSIGKKK